MNLLTKIAVFIVMSVVGITIGAIAAEILGFPKGGIPALIGVIFGALGWKLVGNKNNQED